MFFVKSISTDTNTQSADTLATRAKLAGIVAAQYAAAAAQAAGQGVNQGVRTGVVSARGWAAPRLDSTADYWTNTVAPKVSSALRASARQISPEPAAQESKRPAALIRGLLAAAVLAAIGAAGALVRYRYRAAVTADTEEARESQAATATDTAVSPERPTAAEQEAPVNGRVSASGW